MSSRSEILSKIKANKPASSLVPEIDLEVFNEDLNLLNEFKKMVEAVGGKIFSTSSNADLLKQVKTLFSENQNNYSVLKDSGDFNTIDLEKIENPHDLEDLDVLVLEGEFGVAENGAIWLTENQIPIRVLPFITKNLVLVIDKTKIVPYMHQAYQRLKNLDYNYGLFISGPSKTADIEQSLVIGAQGALSLTVFLK